MSRPKLKLFVDAEVLTSSHISGIGYYTLELLRAVDRAIENRSDIVVELGVFYKQVRKIRSYGFRNFKVRRTLFPLRIANALKIRGLQLPYDLFFGKRVYYFPNFTNWPTWFSPSITAIYDLSYERFPQYAEPRNQAFLSAQVKKAAAHSTKILTISEFSKSEIASFYGKPTKDIAVIYPGIDQSIFFRWPTDQAAIIKKQYGISGEYIVFVGNIEPRKNIKNLLLAYEALDPKIRKRYSLLLVGAEGWQNSEIHEIMGRLRKNGNTIQQPNAYMKTADLAAIYSGAALCVYPSVYEGFGIPPLEAMACGVPTITSNNSSLPEAVGDAAIMVDAESVAALTAAIERTLADTKLSHELIAKGFAQADKFNWDREAQKFLDLLFEVGK